MAVICARMAASDSCEKSSRSRRSVRRRVFDGRDGCERAGKLARSRVSDGRDACDEGRDAMDDEVGEATSDAMMDKRELELDRGVVFVWMFGSVFPLIVVSM